MERGGAQSVTAGQGSSYCGQTNMMIRNSLLLVLVSRTRNAKITKEFKMFLFALCTVSYLVKAKNIF